MSESDRAFELFRMLTNSYDKCRAMIDAWIQEDRREDEVLDFKSGQAFKGDINDLFSTAVSGFANTSGGTLVFGVDARKKPVPYTGTRIDCASAVSLVDNCFAAAETLRSKVLQAVTEHLPGIEIVAI